MSEAFLEPLRQAIFGLVPAALVFIVLAIILKREKVLEELMAARREIGTNLGLLLFNALVLLPLAALPIAALREAMPRAEALVAFWQSVPAVLALLAAIVAIDFAAYWRHRFEHSRLLWRVHATHHADEAMNWLTLHRKHPLGELLSMAVDLLPALLLGVPIGVMVMAVMVRSAWGYFIHADVPWTLGVFGGVVMSPAAHRLHHIRDEALMGGNYGNTITMWDRLFGTYTDPALYVNCETGIAEGTRDVVGELLRPFELRYWKTAPEAATEPAE